MVRSAVRDNLRAAANLIEQRGLAKDTFGGETHDDPVCLLRALQLAKSCDIWKVGEEAIALADFLCLDRTDAVFGGPSVGTRDRESRAMGILIKWAEAAERTPAQVCNALLRAAA